MGKLPQLVVAATLSAFTAACSVFGVRTAKEPAYAVVLAEGDKEIRRYNSYLVARTEVRGDYDDSGSQAFRRLFKYIDGNNQGERDIAMTAPVVQQARAGDEIAMTAPVVQSKDGQTWQMDFVLPAKYTGNTAPKPNDERIEILEVPSRTVATIRYTGLVSDADIRDKTRVLKAWMQDKPYRITSQARSARYDPPFTIPFLRRNEVHVTVEPQSEPES